VYYTSVHIIDTKGVNRINHKS